MQHRGDDRDVVRRHQRKRSRRTSSGPSLRNNKCMNKNVMWGVSFLALVFVSIFKSMHLLEQQEQRHVLLRIGGMNNHHSNNNQRNIENAETYSDIIHQLRRQKEERDALLLRDDMAISQSTSDTTMDNNTGRFIIFKKILSGQGAGNIMNGLLAAHLLGKEFNRTVCVEKSYTQFHAAFEAIDPYAVNHCPKLAANTNMVHKKNRLETISYSKPPDECHLQERLASQEQVVTLLANTYPRWPIVTEENFFFQHYRPRQELIDILPYSDNNARRSDDNGDVNDRQRQLLSDSRRPLVVVHLRAPDPGAKDRRNGLDEDSLWALGETLPRGPSTYLVTNRVDWYQRFEVNYGWSHPNWETVAHSGQGSVSWESHNGEAIVDRKTPKQPKKTTKDSATVAVVKNNNVRNLQMWADWYTLLCAKKIYHTHSDFSNSAVHWMNIDSWIIKGYNKTLGGDLILVREPWVRDGATPALRDRRPRSRVEDGDVIKDDDDKATLRHCNESAAKTTNVIKKRTPPARLSTSR